MAQEEVQNEVEYNGADISYFAFKPQLLVQAHDAIQFYKSAFGAEEVNRVAVMQRTNLRLATSLLSISDDTTQVKSGGVEFCLETDDVDGAIAKAIKAGAVAEGEVSEVEFVGRVGKVKDPYGYVWAISTPTLPLNNASQLSSPSDESLQYADYCPFPALSEITFNQPPSPSTTQIREYIRIDNENRDAAIALPNAADDGEETDDDVIFYAEGVQESDAAAESFEDSNQELKAAKEVLSNNEMITVTNFAEVEILFDRGLLKNKKMWIHSSMPPRELVAVHNLVQNLSIRMIIENTLTEEERSIAIDRQGKLKLFEEMFPNWVESESDGGDSEESN